MAFVGKEAYRGAFNERPELGVQERTLGETRLFVLPSTSPANAAVPWWDRLRWFLELSARVHGLPRAVVSNADDAFLKGLLQKNGLAFDHVITSEGVRAYKPRARIFEVALDRLRMEPDQVVHVGDSLTADVEGAGRLGIRTVWVNRAGLARGATDPRPDHEIPDLTPLPELLESLRRGE